MMPQCPACTLCELVGPPNSGLWLAARGLEAQAASSMDNVRGGFLRTAGGNVCPFPTIGFIK
jgi:hypothetical protein